MMEQRRHSEEKVRKDGWMQGEKIGKVQHGYVCFLSKARATDPSPFCWSCRMLITEAMILVKEKAFIYQVARCEERYLPDSNLSPQKGLEVFMG